MTVRKKTRARYRRLEEEPRTEYHMNPETTHCYADCEGLTYPHYLGEHTSEHEAAQRLRARLAGGVA